MRKVIFSLMLFAVTCIYAQPFAKMYNGHEYVDLGLSAKWATCNIGASKMEQFGSVFEWGDVTPYQIVKYGEFGKAEKHVTYVPSRKVVDSDGFETWEDEHFENIGDDIAGTKYDASRKLWGGKWRMPSYSDFIELTENCTCESLSRNGTLGLKFTSKKNGNWIFMPFGVVKGSDYCIEGYWTSCHSRLFPDRKRKWPEFERIADEYAIYINFWPSGSKKAVAHGASIWRRAPIRPIWK